jgi:signal transduction histidine kinase
VSPLVALVVGLVLGGVVVATILLRFPRNDDGPGDATVVGPPEAAFARRLLDLMDPAVVLVDVDDAVLLANPSARALGIVRGSRLLVPELLSLVQAVRNGGSRRADVRLPGDLAGAGPRLMGVHGVRLHSGTVPLPGPVALVLQDVTEARRTEAVRRDFVANVGHELKTPVGALALLAEAIEQAADDPEAVQRFAGRITREADRLARLVRELIDLSRLQGGEPLPEFVPVQVDDVIAEAVDRTRTAAKAKDLEIAVGGRPGLVVRGVESQLVTAVTNLLANAVAYSSGENRIAVAGRAGPAAGLRALLPGGPVAGQQHRGNGPGPGHRQARRQQPRGIGVRVERGGTGFDVHPAHPARGR